MKIVIRISKVVLKITDHIRQTLSNSTIFEQFMDNIYEHAFAKWYTTIFGKFSDNIYGKK